MNNEWMKEDREGIEPGGAVVAGFSFSGD